MKQDKLKILYFQITDIWKLHCEFHSELFDLTCDEYMHLLESDLDKLEIKVQEKNNLLMKIKMNEQERERLLSDVKKEFSDNKISSVTDLISIFQDFAPEKESKHLFRFNALLVDIVSKIQAQNKKNQLFINKALSSLKEIRQSATGKKALTTYNNKGVSNSRLINASP